MTTLWWQHVCAQGIKSISSRSTTGKCEKQKPGQHRIRLFEKVVDRTKTLTARSMYSCYELQQGCFCLVSEQGAPRGVVQRSILVQITSKESAILFGLLRTVSTERATRRRVLEGKGLEDTDYWSRELAYLT